MVPRSTEADLEKYDGITYRRCCVEKDPNKTPVRLRPVRAFSVVSHLEWRAPPSENTSESSGPAEPDPPREPGASPIGTHFSPYSYRDQTCLPRQEKHRLPLTSLRVTRTSQHSSAPSKPRTSSTRSRAKDRSPSSLLRTTPSRTFQGTPSRTS